MKHPISFSIFIFLCFFFQVLCAQKGSEKGRTQKNKQPLEKPAGVIKLNLTPLLFKSLSLQVEHRIHRKISLGFQFNRMFNHKMLFVKLPISNRSNITIEGYSLTPEIRLYPFAKYDRPAPNGFYIGGYYRYAKRTIRWDRYTDLFTLNNTINYHAYTCGFFLGKQWIIGKHVSIDWLIAGIGYGTSRIEGGFHVPDVSLPESVQEILRNEYYDMFDGFLANVFGFSGANFDTSTNSLNVVVRNVPAYSFRLMGISFGYAF